MRRLLLPLLSAALLFGFTPGARAADDDVKAIITKALKAMGGEERVLKYKAAQVKSKGTIVLMGTELEFTQDISTMRPDKLKDTLELSKGGTPVVTRTLWYNGDKLTIEANGKEVPLKEDMIKAIKELFKEVGHMGNVSTLVPLLKEKDFELSLIGDEKVEGKAVVGVLVKSKGHKDVSLYFNKETGLLAKVQRRTVKEGTETEVSEERIIKEYGKEKDGLPVVKKILVKHDGEKFIEAEVIETKHLEKLDDSEFKK